MAERLTLPHKGRSAEFMADYTLTERGGVIVATEGWICAPRRGNEIMHIVMDELQSIASARGKTVVHEYEASTPKGRNLIQRFSEYQWAGRSATHNPIYKREYKP